IALIVVGAVMLFFSENIAGKVAAGQSRINSAQGQVNSTNSLFNSSRYTKPFGQAFTGGAQNQIDQGQQQVDFYGNVANTMRFGGIALILIGIGFIYFGRKKKSS
ncbi:MAG: hypothetical protein KGI83_07595, partial [Verrucomicrobiota bacterium]|nr:hypothetical protein [Verrucomicrobiota bacterium]